jgi:PAS domain S-box-containing protein
MRERFCSLALQKLLEKMNKANKSESSLLSQKAERILKGRLKRSTEQLTKADALKLIQELEVHQIELELQNQKLIIAKEQIAKTADDKFAELYDFAPSGYITLSREGKILGLNLCAARMLGMERSHITGSSFANFVSAETKPILNGFLKKIFESKSREFCQLILSINGNMPVYVHIVGITHENENSCHVNVVDITELKLAEQSIMISQEKYRTLLNASPEGILLVDLKGIITEVSEIGLELFSVNSRNDIIGKDLYRYVPSKEKRSLRTLIEKTMNEGLVQNMGILLKKNNHSLFFSEMSSTLIQDQNGIPVSYMIIIRDISQRKKTETKQFHADRMASLGEMASGIAHEINQPLNTISLALDNILYEASNNNESIKKDYLQLKSEKIFENITRIRNIIDHVRAFSKSDDDYILTGFDVNMSIKNAVSMISEQFNHLAIKLNLQLEENLPLIIGNTYKLEQVILNLLSNAKDALIEKKSSKSELYDMVAGIKTFYENQSIIIEISDNGTGIKEDDIDHIMLPFYTTKDSGKGTGLGLSISYQIIKEMNGTIEFSGNTLSGTIFKIVLNTSKTD